MRRIAALVMLLALALPGAAAAACPKTTLGDVEDEVMCPTCGVPLELATEAPQANRERAFIQREVEACKSKQQIKDDLVDQLGERVLALPPDKGFNIAAYLIPAAVIVVGIGAVAALAAKRRRAPATANGTSAPPLPGDDAARLEQDLKSYDL